MRIVTEVDVNSLRGMCIKHKYYTRGDNDAYETMLYKYDGKYVTGKAIRTLAEDILRHSDTLDSLIDIADNIMAEATITFVVYKDNSHTV